VAAEAREPKLTIADEGPRFSRKSSTAPALQNGPTMISRWFRLVALVALAAPALGCMGSGRNKVQDSSDVSDDFDQQEWANTSPVGDGSEESGGYYGAPGPTTPARRAASPEPAPATRTPASPRLGGD
jgi:hypothetical protein